MPSNALDAIDAEVARLDDAIARAGAFGAKVERLRLLQRLDWSPETTSALEAAIADYDARLEALRAARAKVESARAELVAARHAIAALQAAPVPLPLRTVSPLVVSELAATAAEMANALSLFRAVREEPEAA